MMENGGRVRGMEEEKRVWVGRGGGRGVDFKRACGWRVLIRWRSFVYAQIG